jgi:predicted RecA/RadA family phage recombinase
MINFVEPGNVVAITVTRDVKSGDGFFKGKLFGVVTNDAKNGTKAQLLIQGAVSLKKAGAFNPAEGAAAVFDEPSQTLISGAGTSVGYVITTNDPDDATRAWVRLIPSFA